MSMNRQSPEAGSPYRGQALPTEDGRRAVVCQSHPSLRPMGLAVLLLVLWVATIFWRQHQVRTAIIALPSSERQAAYSRALKELQSLCKEQPDLSEHCGQEAEFALTFPQCDDECRFLAYGFLNHARR